MCTETLGRCSPQYMKRHLGPGLHLGQVCGGGAAGGGAAGGGLGVGGGEEEGGRAGGGGGKGGWQSRMRRPIPGA